MVKEDNEQPVETDLITITEEEAGERLDKILAHRFQERQSRTYFQGLIADGLVVLNGAPTKKRVKPHVGDEVEIHFALTPEIDVSPEPIPLDILYEDEAILVVNKPAGMVVHPALGNWTGTFVNALLYHCREIERGEDVLRPGIVHRLDKETSGVLVAAKTTQAHQALVAMFSQREVEKDYLAICVGLLGDVEIHLPIGRHPVHRKLMTVRMEGGREATTLCKTVAYDGELSVVEITLLTGRTHQIRVHTQHHGAPVLGDATYGSSKANAKFGVERQLLHAWRLRFAHPTTGKPMAFEAPIPEDMAKWIKRIEKGRK